MSTIAHALVSALSMAFAMGWEILWPLILGFALSGVVQAVISHKEMSRLLPVNFRLYLVQPGLSKRAASPDQLMLLSVTENYLFEMYQLSFGVIASE